LELSCHLERRLGSRLSPPHPAGEDGWWPWLRASAEGEESKDGAFAGLFPTHASEAVSV